jgi:predicted anti-sigma-YlaC factor YlaD
MRCEDFQKLLRQYLDETLDEDSRRQFRRHLGACAPCREWALAVEPSLFFALAGEPQADADRVEACAQAISAHVRQSRLARRLGARRRPLLAAAAALVVVIGGGIVWRVVGIGHHVPPAAISAAGTESAATPAPPTVEIDMAGEDVRVYRFATDDNQDTAVYFVVNPAMEL